MTSSDPRPEGIEATSNNAQIIANASVNPLAAQLDEREVFRLQREANYEGELTALRQRLSEAEQELSAEQGMSYGLAEKLNEAEQQVAALTAERDRDTAIQRTRWIQCDHARQEAESQLVALRSALAGLSQTWKDSAEMLRLRKGQMTREKRGHEILANCADDLAALLKEAK